VKPLAQAATLIERYADEVRASLPDGARLFDAHAHVGRDDDGAALSSSELVELYRRFGIAGGFVFAMNEPDRAPAFRAANDRTLAAAADSGGMLVPFARLDLADGAEEEARRALNRGARGIKLHTRAQPLARRERELERVFELAAEQRAPIIVHGGRGMPPIAALLADVFERTPDARLIVAHAGIADLDTFAHRLAGQPGAYFDTSVWSPFDLLAAFAVLPPEQLLFGSDLPYGQLPNMLLLALRAAAVAGWDERAVSGLLGEHTAALATGEQPAAPTVPRGSARIDLDLAQLRVHHYLAGALQLLWSRRSAVDSLIALAETAAADERVRALLACARGLWLEAARAAADERFALNRMVFQLLHLADLEVVLAAATPARLSASVLAGAPGGAA
jgi:hypothetical protein